MLDALKAASAIGQLMKNKDALKDASVRVRQKLADLRCQGSAGGGAVRVTVSGEMRVIDVHIEPAALAPSASDAGGRALVQTFIAEATNDAITRAKEAAQREIQREAEAMGLGEFAGLGKMLS